MIMMPLSLMQKLCHTGRLARRNHIICQVVGPSLRPWSSSSLSFQPLSTQRLTKSEDLVTRGPTSQDLKYFRSILSRPDRSVLASLPSSVGADSQQTSPQDYTEASTQAQETHDLIARYNQDWTNHYHGSSNLVLRPNSTSEVSSILRYCHENFIAVVPQGGNTGLCGAATPLRDEIILSLEDMNVIHAIDKHSGILTCDAGCILENLHGYANENGYLLPLDIGAKGSCQIGGNVSTNAGGQYFFRFGGLHGTVMGLEVVLPDGRVMHLNMEMNDEQQHHGTGATTTQLLQPGSSTSHRKDNTGYDLKHLFIGAEGTLGIVTKVAIACPALPTSRNATLLVCDSYENVLRVLQTAKEELGEIMSAIELMDYKMLELVQQAFVSSGNDSRLLRDMMLPSSSELESSKADQQIDDVSQPLFLLVETQGSNSDHDASKIDSFLTRLYDNDIISNGFLAQDTKQIMEMWKIRESCNPSAAQAGCVYKFDVSIPIEDYVDVAKEVEKKLMASSSSSATMANPSGMTVVIWGHIADGNAHINIITPGKYEKDDILSKHIETTVYDAVLKRRGSISAEHGLGQLKNEYLGQIKEKSVLDVMSGMKALFDPHGIMNPGKYLPSSNGQD